MDGKVLRLCEAPLFFGLQLKQLIIFLGILRTVLSEVFRILPDLRDSNLFGVKD